MENLKMQEVQRLRRRIAKARRRVEKGKRLRQEAGAAVDEELIAQRLTGRLLELLEEEP